MNKSLKVISTSIVALFDFKKDDNGRFTIVPDNHLLRDLATIENLFALNLFGGKKNERIRFLDSSIIQFEDKHFIESSYDKLNVKYDKERNDIESDDLTDCFSKLYNQAIETSLPIKAIGVNIHVSKPYTNPTKTLQNLIPDKLHRLNDYAIINLAPKISYQVDNFRLNITSDKLVEKNEILFSANFHRDLQDKLDFKTLFPDEKPFDGKLDLIKTFIKNLGK